MCAACEVRSRTFHLARPGGAERRGVVGEAQGFTTRPYRRAYDRPDDMLVMSVN